MKNFIIAILLAPIIGYMATTLSIRNIDSPSIQRITQPMVRFEDYAF